MIVLDQEHALQNVNAKERLGEPPNTIEMKTKLC